ncbi:hypothetical protein ABF66_03420 [Enterobacter roggenkampii]|nr:hypothetical protein SR65_01650 [Enterobacter roggenkampii]KLP40599.1 hypothetical protein ABF66_03420 [Enterobacter roggenkampii]
MSGITVDYFSVDGVKERQTIWLVFATYALALAVVFYFSFNYRHTCKNSEMRTVAHSISPVEGERP